MKKILFIVGTALGHAARAVIIARGLQRSGYEIHFAGADTRSLTQDVVVPTFPFHKLAGKTKEDNGLAFANALTDCIERVSPHALCYDLTPFPWLIQLPRFPIPEVYITNAFLTGLGSHQTIQDNLFAKRATHWNRLRAQCGLPPLAGSRVLYERDLVLLADPPAWLADRALPAHYRVIGPCSWDAPVPLPKEVRPLQNILYVSTGSPGARKIPEAFVRRLAEELGCPHIVGVKGDGSLKHLTALFYARLPGAEVLSRTRFALTHGGTGSVYQALEQGVPVGCWPTHGNHRVFGRWIEQLGLAVLFEPDTWETKVSGLRDRLPQLTVRARQLAQSLEALDSGFEASKHIERLLNSRPTRLVK